MTYIQRAIALTSLLFALTVLPGCGERPGADQPDAARQDAVRSDAGQPDAIGAAKEADEQEDVTGTGTADIRAIAEEGFIFGLPLVMNYMTLYEFVVDKNSGQYKGPFNQIVNEARVFTWEDTSIVTPNSDTPYSMLWLDLRAEPMVISVPAVPAPRYYSVQLVDGNTFNYGYIGSRTTGTDAGDYLVTGPRWQGETPPGIRQTFASSTDFALTIFRTQLFNPEDMPNVVAVQAGYRVQPLSSYLDQPAPPAAPAIDFPKIDRELVKTDFFEYLDFALRFAPPGPEETAIREKLASIGVGPGRISDFRDLPDAHKAELLLGMQQGSDRIDRYLANGLLNVNGWNLADPFGDRAFFDGDWLKRAASARAGIFGNDVEEATYPMTRRDSDGDELDGSKHNYTLTFAASDLPPVIAFWSVTMYDGRTQLLIRNPIDRYLINSPMLPHLKRGEDGSLTLYIQKDSPGADRESNWLPAPDGPIYLVMRLYWPRTENPAILPIGQGSWQPPGLVKAQ